MIPGSSSGTWPQIRHATCTSPICRRPARTCDFEHNTSYEAGGRTCLCNVGPKCRHDQLAHVASHGCGVPAGWCPGLPSL